MRVFLLILGMALLVLGAQGAIRLLVNNADAGLTAWIPGGFPVQIAVSIVAAVVGAILLAITSKGVRGTKA